MGVDLSGIASKHRVGPDASRDTALAAASAIYPTVAHHWPETKKHPPRGWAACVCVYADALIKGKKSEDAISFLLPLISSEGLLCDDAIAITTYAKALSMVRAPEEAAAFLTPCLAQGGILELDPWAHNIFAKTLDKMGRPDAAVAHLESIIKKNLFGNNSWIHITYSKMLHRAGHPEATVTHLMPHLGENGFLAHERMAFCNAVDALAELGRFDEALHTLSRFPEKDCFLFHFISSKILICADRRAAAEPHIISAVRKAEKPIHQLHAAALVQCVLAEDHPISRVVAQTIPPEKWAHATTLAQEWTIAPRMIGLGLSPPVGSYGIPGRYRRLGTSGRGIDGLAIRVTERSRLDY